MHKSWLLAVFVLQEVLPIPLDGFLLIPSPPLMVGRVLYSVFSLLVGACPFLPDQDLGQDVPFFFIPYSKRFENMF